MGEKTTHLTPTERRLLDCLVRNAGRIVSHRELLEAIGNPSYNIGSLQEHIYCLRKKIEKDPASQGHHKSLWAGILFPWEGRGAVVSRRGIAVTLHTVI